MIDCKNSNPAENLSDEMLVSIAAVEQSALRTLIQRYEKIVQCTANAMAKNYADAEDYAEEGLLGLLAAVSAFSAEKSVSFQTFACVCIQNRIRSAYAKRRQCDDISLISLDDTEHFDASMLLDDAPSPEQEYLQKERISELYQRMDAVLSKLEMEIFSLYVSGYSYAEIAARKEISEKSVDNAIMRARRKLRAVWGNNKTAAV